MKHFTWLSICPLLLCSLPLLGEEQGGRHFNFNPGNMANGMMNPVRNMFGGYDRNQGYYYDYPYYGPQSYPYYPQEQRYPRDYYAYPPAPAAQYPNNATYQSATQSVPHQIPSHYEPATPDFQQGPVATPSAPYPSSSPREQFRYRPTDQMGSAQYPEYAPNMTYQHPSAYDQGAAPNYDTTPQPSNSSGYPSHNYRPLQQSPSSQTGSYQNPPIYNSGYGDTGVSVQPAMKFRPLDQPGQAQ
jgi:hypothetical protein